MLNVTMQLHMSTQNLHWSSVTLYNWTLSQRFLNEKYLLEIPD